MKLSIISLAIVGLASCVSASVSEGACYTDTISFPIPVLPSPPANVPDFSVNLPAISSPPITEDFSGTLDKITDVANSVSVQVNGLSIDNSSGSTSMLPVARCPKCCSLHTQHPALLLISWR